MRKEAKSEWGSTADGPFAYMLIRPPFRTQFNSSRHPPVGGMGQSVGVSHRIRYLLWGSISESTRELPQPETSAQQYPVRIASRDKEVLLLSALTSYHQQNVRCVNLKGVSGSIITPRMTHLIALDTKPLDPFLPLCPDQD